MADPTPQGTENKDPDSGAENGGGADERRDELKGLIKESLKEFADENGPVKSSRKEAEKSPGQKLWDFLGF